MTDEYDGYDCKDIDELLEQEKQIETMNEAQIRAYAKKMLAILAWCCKTAPRLEAEYNRLAGAVSVGRVGAIKSAITKINSLIREHLAKVREPSPFEINLDKTPSPFDD